MEDGTDFYEDDIDSSNPKAFTLVEKMNQFSAGAKERGEYALLEKMTEEYKEACEIVKRFEEVFLK